MSSNEIFIAYKKLYLDSPDLQEPVYESAGYDLCAYGDYTIEPGGMSTIATGIAIEIPEGFAGIILGRSGLAFRKGVFVFNGLIDPDYRGEINILVVNKGRSSVIINHGDRCAQLLIVPFLCLPVQAKTELQKTERGTKAFGST